MGSLMVDLVQWLTAQLDEDERIARAATPGPWEQTPARPGTLASAEYWHVVDCSETPAARENAEHIAAWDPARVLREIEAKRRIIDQHERYAAERRRMMGGWDPQSDDSPILAALAAVYADRPNYRKEWRP